MIGRLIRNRLAGSEYQTQQASERELSRLVLRRAAEAGRIRDQALLASLDRVLDRIAGGITEGARRRLDRLLRAKSGPPGFECWLADYPRGAIGPWRVQLQAALFGITS
jgi:hypothetical protein